MNKPRYKKVMVILIHAAVWILLFSLPTLLRHTSDQNEPKQPEAVDATMRFIAARFTDLLLICFLPECRRINGSGCFTKKDIYYMSLAFYMLCGLQY
jgi:hypothetical protein